MLQEERAWGMGIINSFLPSVRAGTYLERVNAVGFHHVNDLYRLHYPTGAEGVLMLFTLQGEGCLQLQGQKHRLTASSIAIVPRDTEMAYHTVGGSWVFYWINLNGVRTEHLARTLLSEGKNCFSVQSMARYEQHILPLLHIEGDKLRQEMAISLAIHLLEDEMLGELFFAPTRQAKLSSDVIAYLEKHCAEKITLDALAKRFFLSPNRLIEVFRQETGRTPYAYLKAYRLNRARELLQTTDMTALEIARAVGFGNASNFGYQFNQAFGISPNAWRQQLHHGTDAKRQKK